MEISLELWDSFRNSLLGTNIEGLSEAIFTIYSKAFKITIANREWLTRSVASIYSDCQNTSLNEIWTKVVNTNYPDCPITDAPDLLVAKLGILGVVLYIQNTHGRQLLSSYHELISKGSYDQLAEWHTGAVDFDDKEMKLLFQFANITRILFAAVPSSKNKHKYLDACGLVTEGRKYPLGKNKSHATQRRICIFHGETGAPPNAPTKIARLRPIEINDASGNILTRFDVEFIAPLIMPPSNVVDLDSNNMMPVSNNKRNVADSSSSSALPASKRPCLSFCSDLMHSHSALSYSFNTLVHGTNSAQTSFIVPTSNYIQGASMSLNIEGNNMATRGGDDIRVAVGNGEMWYSKSAIILGISQEFNLAPEKIDIVNNHDVVLISVEDNDQIEDLPEEVKELCCKNLFLYGH